MSTKDRQSSSSNLASLAGLYKIAEKEQALKVKATLLEALIEIQTSFMRGGDIEDSLSPLLDLFCKKTRSTTAFVLLCETNRIPKEASSNNLICRAGSIENNGDFTSSDSTEECQEFIAGLFPKLLEIKLNGTTVLCTTDCSYWLGLTPEQQKLPFISFAIIPLIHEEVTVGLLGMMNRPGGYDKDLLERIDPIVKGTTNILRARQVRQERDKSTKQLNQTIEELTESNSKLKEFTYLVSHDIRKHSANLKMISDILPDIKAENKNEYYSMMDTSIRSLGLTVDFIANIVDLESTKIPNDKVNLSQLIEELFDALKVESTVTLTHNIPPTVVVVAPYAFINSVFSNIIENSIKYRKKRNPTININFQIKDDEIVIDFTDNGIGFNREESNGRVFDMFQTFHNRPDSRGLGLFLVKKYIEKLGWDIKIQSKEGKGTTVTVLLSKDKAQGI